MTDKELEKLSDCLRKDAVSHILIARMRKGISISSVATGDDIYEFLQVLADIDEEILDIMQAVINSRSKKKEGNVLLN